MEKIILVLFLLAVIVFLKIYFKKSKLALQALYDYYDFADKIDELLDAPCMTDKKWKELIPIAEFADKRFLETHPFLKDNFFSQANKIRQIINPDFTPV